MEQKAAMGNMRYSTGAKTEKCSVNITQKQKV